MRRVSWNYERWRVRSTQPWVTPRMRRVSWNFHIFQHWQKFTRSRLAWGVWVEIHVDGEVRVTIRRHASHEACELKLYLFSIASLWGKVTPRMRRVSWNVPLSPQNSTPSTSRLAWGVWVEIDNSSFVIMLKQSRLAWGVWVEIIHKQENRTSSAVTPRMRRVSWNLVIKKTSYKSRCHASHEACELKLNKYQNHSMLYNVTPRMRRVSWNYTVWNQH